MSESRPQPAARSSEAQPDEGRGGEVRHLPVPVEPLQPRPVDPFGGRAVATADRPAVPMPLVAAGGFLAGVATWLLARVLVPRRRVSIGRRGRRQKGIEISGSRSFLVDVHLIKR